jgi:hypothetical protein
VQGQSAGVFRPLSARMRLSRATTILAVGIAASAFIFLTSQFALHYDDSQPMGKNFQVMLQDAYGAFQSANNETNSSTGLSFNIRSNLMDFTNSSLNWHLPNHVKFADIASDISLDHLLSLIRGGGSQSLNGTEELTDQTQARGDASGEDGSTLFRRAFAAARQAAGFNSSADSPSEDATATGQGTFLQRAIAAAKSAVAGASAGAGVGGVESLTPSQPHTSLRSGDVTTLTPNTKPPIPTSLAPTLENQSRPTPPQSSNIGFGAHSAQQMHHPAAPLESFDPAERHHQNQQTRKEPGRTEQPTAVDAGIMPAGAEATPGSAQEAAEREYAAAIAHQQPPRETGRTGQSTAVESGTSQAGAGTLRDAAQETAEREYASAIAHQQPHREAGRTGPSIAVDAGTVQAGTNTSPGSAQEAAEREYAAAIAAGAARAISPPVTSSVATSVTSSLTTTRTDNGIGAVNAATIAAATGVPNTQQMTCRQSFEPTCDMYNYVRFWNHRFFPEDCYNSPLRPALKEKTPYDQQKYVVFEPDWGGWNNIRMVRVSPL